MKYFILLPLLLLFGCASSGIMIVSEADNGSQISLNSQDRFKIELTSNPSTGYQWIIRSFDENILQQIGETEFDQESGLLGAPQVQTFMFRIINPGTSDLFLYYLRPWEGEQEPIDSFYLQIKAH